MRILALALVAALAATGCQSNKALVRITNPDDPFVEVRIGITNLTLKGKVTACGGWTNRLAEILKASGAGKEHQEVHVVLQSEDGVCYEDDAKVVYACYLAKVRNLDYGGVSVLVPKEFRPILESVKDGKPHVLLPPPDNRPRIRIEMYEVGPDGEYQGDGKNDWVDIVLDGKQSLFRAGGPQESAKAMQLEFTELQDRLREKSAAGVPPDMLVEIVPTMACKHAWVVQACKAVAAAGFTNIELAFPYE